MRGYIFTSNLFKESMMKRIFPSAILVAICLFMLPQTVFSEDRTLQPEEDDFSSSPFADYGEFNEEAEEIEDLKFFQHGRFFGISLGTGFEGISSNRGMLWQGGFPVIDFKVHYWFDFNVAMDLGFYTASHFFETTQANGGHVDISFMRLGLDVKYYFDTKNVSAAVSFANPYVLIGGGSFSKTETSVDQQTVDQDSGFGFSAGAGVEFAIKPKKIYFSVEPKAHFVNFKDTYSKKYGTDDLSGIFYTITGSLMFTW